MANIGGLTGCQPGTPGPGAASQTRARTHTHTVPASVCNPTASEEFGSANDSCSVTAQTGKRVLNFRPAMFAEAL